MFISMRIERIIGEEFGDSYDDYVEGLGCHS
jgi:hypothetical protein